MSGRGTADFSAPISEVAIAIVERAVSPQLWVLFLDIKQVGTSLNIGLCKFTNKQIPRPHPGLEKSEYLKLDSSGEKRVEMELGWQALPSTHEVLGSIPNVINQGWWCTSVMSAPEVEAAGSEVQCHPQLQSKSEASLSYVRPCLKEKHPRSLRLGLATLRGFSKVF